MAGLLFALPIWYNIPVKRTIAEMFAMDAMSVFIWLLFIVHVIIAVLFCFSGYRHFRALISIYVFLTVFPNMMEYMAGVPGLSPTAVLLISLGIAVLLTALTWAIYKVAIFMCGGLLGLWIASVIIQPGGDMTPRIVLSIILFIILGIITIKLRKPLIVLSSAIIGGFSLFVYGYYILFEFANIARLEFTEAAQLPVRFADIIGSNYLLYIIPIVLAILGMVAQGRSTRDRRKRPQRDY